MFGLLVSLMKIASELVADFDVDDLSSLEGGVIRTDKHCYGCTAGSGSSCGGALA